MLRAHRTVPLLALVTLSASTLAVAGRLEVQVERPYDVALVPPTAIMRWLSLGHPTLAANTTWLRAVQYIGERRADARGWDKLFPLLDLVTDLDPKHGYAYQVGGNVLVSAGRIAESNALLEKGMKACPERYILPFQRAVNSFMYEGDYATAGEFFKKAAAVPGAPPRVAGYAATMFVKGGRADAALAMLEHLYAAAEDDESRKAIARQVADAKFERVALALDDALDRYTADHGFRPLDLSVLVGAGYIRRLPDDPAGGRLVIGPDGRVRSTVRDRRWSRPQAPTSPSAVRALEADQAERNDLR